MKVTKGNRYKLREPKLFDDELGKGYGYAEPLADCEAYPECAVDCFITTKDGRRHPGRPYPTTIRLSALMAGDRTIQQDSTLDM